jgi:hypothetical protein
VVLLELVLRRQAAVYILQRQGRIAGHVRFILGENLPYS